MRFAAFTAAFFLLCSCANYSSRIRGPRMYFEAGEYDHAIDGVKQLVDRNDKDILLYLMDLGLMYHTAGRYQEAIDTFLKADQLGELKDYTSVTQEAASLVVSDEAKTYKGDDYEKILIHVYLALDYTMLGKLDDALVESRRVNQKLDVMISAGKLPYDRNPFAKYLSASLFESQHELNDAFVDYRQLFKWIGPYSYLGIPLLRVANQLGASEEFDEYKTKFPQTTKFRLNKAEGEVILILEQGKAPIKYPAPEFRLMPKMMRRWYSSDYGWLRDSSGAYKARTYTLYDIEMTAVKELDHKLGKIIAKKIGGMVVKGAVGYGVAKATNSEALGELTAYLLLAVDSADLRSWSTLPAHIQIARLTLPAGKYDLVLDSVDRYGATAGGVKQWPGYEVKAGEITFINYRFRD